MKKAVLGLACLVLPVICGANPTLAGSGAELFAATCAACHGEAGVGTLGLAPPLQHKELWQRLGEKSPKYIAGVMANGMSGRLNVNGEDYIGLVMPPMAHLSSEDLAAIATYVLVTLNGMATAPDVTLIETMKQKTLSHKELQALRKAE